MIKKSNKPSGEKNARTGELVKILKEMAEDRGINQYHASGICFRKGNATTSLVLEEEERTTMQDAMKSMIARGKKWTNAKTPAKHNAVSMDKRGPFATRANWDQVDATPAGFEE
jgi:hypothetical protein